MKGFERSIHDELKRYRSDGLFREMDVIETECLPRVVIDGTRHVNFSSNNYLAMNGAPRIRAAMIDAIEKWGTSAGASRLTAGNLKIFEDAEKALAGFKTRQAALMFNSGYQANVGVISALAGPDDEVFSDELNHASIIDGCRMSRTKVSVYRHADPGALEKLLRLSTARRRFVITESVFSMDGDMAPVPDILGLAKTYEAVLIIDDAHATGVLGEKGGGSGEYFGIHEEEYMVLGTGGKALGVSGAFFCCSRIVRDYLVNRCRAFIYSTAASPCVPAGLAAAVELVKSDSGRRRKLMDLAGYFHERLRRGGYSTCAAPSHITPVIIGDNDKAIRVEKELRKAGIFAKAIRYPTVAKGTERIRFSLTAGHLKEEIDRVLDILERAM